MKRNLVLIIFTLITFNLYPQKVNFGLNVGAYYTDYEINGQISGGESTNAVPFTIGGFLDYQFNESFGIKSVALLDFATEEFIIQLSGLSNFQFFTIKKTSLLITPLLKYEVNKDYNKGFYLLGGPRVSFVLSSKDNDGNKIDDFYNSTNFGAQLGFGTSLLEHFYFELVGDYGLSNTLDSDNSDAQTVSAYLNLGVNLESIFNN